MLDENSLFELKADEVDSLIYKKIKENWDHISKPIDGLGDFEDLICHIGAIQGTEHPRTKMRAALIFCADNGIVSEAVSQSDKDITLAVARALGKDISSACRLGKHAGVKIIPVDIGIDSDEEIEGVRSLKVAKGTEDFLKAPSMSRDEALLAIDHGISLVKELKDSGIDIISTGEMGIGNTTTATACLCAMLRKEPEKITGRGAGLDDHGLERKKWVIAKALEKYDFDTEKNGKYRALKILTSVGGLDIAALAGVFIGGALHHTPIVVDGLISATAACVAESILPGARCFMIASHSGREHGTRLALESLKLSPYIEGNMALGEGTGALMLFPLLDMVMDFYENGAKFSDYEIEEYERLS